MGSDKAKKEEARVVRLRENKRRSRERQRQYIIDLETRVRDSQQKGIQATVEIQTAARLVAQENRDLRALLGQLGVSEEGITSWLRKRRHDEKGNSSGEDAHHTPTQTTSTLGDSLPDDSTLNKTLPSPGVDLLTTATREQSQQAIPRPCKLLSSLTADSACGNTNPLPVADEDMDSASAQDGLSCSAAYRLVKQHATGEEKLDALAQVLAGGCVSNPNGGCKVKHATLAEALVGFCL